MPNGFHPPPDDRFCCCGNGTERYSIAAESVACARFAGHLRFPFLHSTFALVQPVRRRCSFKSKPLRRRRHESINEIQRPPTFVRQQQQPTRSAPESTLRRGYESGSVATSTIHQRPQEFQASAASTESARPRHFPAARFHQPSAVVSLRQYRPVHFVIGRTGRD